MALDPSQSPFAALGASEGGLDFHQAGKVLLKNAWLLVLLGLVGAFGGLYYLEHLPQIYLAQAVLEVDPVEPKLINFQEAREDDTQDMMDSYVATMKSRPFLTQVVQSNNLAKNPDFFPLGGGVVLTDGMAADILAGFEAVQERPNSRFIEVGVKHPNARMAQFLANALCDELMKKGLRQRADASKLKADFLTAKAESCKRDLTAAEQAQEDFIEKNGALSVIPSEDTELAEMKNEEGNLNAAQAVVTKLEADNQEATKFADQPDKLLNIPSVAESPVIASCRQQIADIETRIVSLGVRYTDLHPKMIQARAELDNANATLKANLARMPTLIQSALDSALIKQKKFEEAETARQDQIKELNKKSVVYNMLHGEVEIKRALYESVLKELGETQVAKDIDVTPLHVFEAALLPGSPMAPSKMKVLAMAIAAGVASGVGIAFGLNALDTSMKSVDQAERVTGLPVAGAIPVASRRLARTGWILQRDPGSSVAEAFRSLRTFLFFKGRQKRPKTVLFTSALPGEGKTLCSINCAVSLAQQGLRTIIVDADLRAPAVARILHPKDDSPGLTAVLEGRSELKAVIQPMEIESLFLLSAGRLAPNPAELLATPELGNLIVELEEQFDCVIIDSAPILPVCDTLLLVPHAQSVCVVVRANKTPRKAILRTSKLLAEAGASVSGLLLNMLSPKSDPDHYVYRQKYGAPENYGKPVEGRLGLPGPKKEIAASSQNGASHD